MRSNLAPCVGGFVVLLTAIAPFGCSGTPKDSPGPVGDPPAGDEAGLSDDGGPIEDAGSGNVFACTVKAPTVCPDPPPHYADVAPIFQQRCILCHAGDIDGPWPLTDYEHISDWQDIIRGDLVVCAMPPPDAGVPITLDERMAILNWIRCGLPK